MRKTIFLAATLLASIVMNAAVITVASGADLQAAINGASSGDQVKVQVGTFTGNFTMKEGVQVSGGWDAQFQSQTDYATVLDANASGRVLNQAAAFTKLTVWSNFTIQNGKLTAALSDQGAAGVFLNKKGRVQHCLVQNNTVATTITGKDADNAMGGGVSCNSGNADPDTVAYDCIIKNNKATHGGGVRVNGKGVVVYKCVIENNETTNNAAGGIQLHNGSKLINCIVRGNKANGNTGGVRLTGGNISDVINCLIVGNVATGQVGGIGMEGNLANIINNTIVGNKQQKAGATASLCGVKVNNGEKIKDNGTSFCNNIVWGNITGDTIAPQGVYYISKYEKNLSHRSYNAIQGQAGDDDKTGATSLILTNADPGFTDAANGDYTLKGTSAMVNFGNKTLNTQPYDLAGNQRVRGGKIDLGCYEFLSPEARNTYVKVGDNLQDSINGTQAGYKVFVEAGTYVGNFTMKEDVQVSGGWNSDFTAQTDYATILDANQSGRVLNQAAAFTTLTVWSNFTIQNGYLASALSDQGAAGVFLNKKGRVQHCLIQNNTVNTTITGKDTDNAMGGGVSCNSGNADPDTVAYDCIIKNNKATHGGGVRVNGKGVVVYKCVIENNETTNNAAGGIQLHNGSWLVNCIVRGNKANGDCGGVRLTGGNISTVINCLIAGNVATNQVGGLGMDGNLANVINNTIVKNKQQKAGATSSLCGVKVNKDKNSNGTYFCNNIVWGNITGDTISPNGVYNISRYDKTQGQRSYNAIQGQKGDDSAETSAQLTAEDPGFTDAANGDYHLTYKSVCLNKGGSNQAPKFDLDGNKRPYGGTPDMGCYELQKLVLDEAADNSARIANKTLDVQIIRTLSNASFNSICLPFALSAAQIEAAFGANCKIMEMESAEMTSDIHLDLNFASVSEMAANVPYIIQPAAEVVDPAFAGVTLVKSSNLDVVCTAATFHGLLAPTALTAGDKTQRFIGADNMLLYPSSDSKMKALRAYFTLGAAPAAGVQVRLMAGGRTIATSVAEAEAAPMEMKKAVVNGQLVIIRDNKMYNAQGQEL